MLYLLDSDQAVLAAMFVGGSAFELGWDGVRWHEVASNLFARVSPTFVAQSYDHTSTFRRCVRDLGPANRVLRRGVTGVFVLLAHGQFVDLPCTC
jgi:hypothetical protein